MLEESISCSPVNSGKKSRSRRFHKNVKKKCEQNVTTTKAENIIQNEPSNLEFLYEESPRSRTNVDTCLEHLNPFEFENLLAAADRADPSPSSKTLNNLTCKGFIRLENLSSNFEDNTCALELPERASLCYSAVTPRSPHVLGPETQFGITESEFERFCNDAESEVLYELTSDERNPTTANVIPKYLFESKVEHTIKTQKIRKSKSVVEEILTDFCGSPTNSEIDEHTPLNSPPINNQGTKSIVDEILEDFCGSPCRENSPKKNSEDATPIFRFKSQTIRTYSGIKKKKLFTEKSATDFNGFTLEYDGNTSDSSSSLSVQEDLTQSIVPQLDTVDLNNSVKLCENLLNLSSYFSQLPSSSSKAKSPTPVAETRDLRLSAIIDEIIKIKSKPLRINWNKIEKEFKGFSDYEGDSKESTLQELLEDEDDVLQQINCDSLCYEKIKPTVSFAHVYSDIENTLLNASAVIEKANALISPKNSLKHKTNKLIKLNQTECLNSPTEDERLFDDIDIWNDNEYLLNYKTQNHVEHKDNDFCIDDFNEHKAISKCKESETGKTIQISKSGTKGELFEPSCKSPQNFKEQQQLQNLKDPCSSVSLKLTENLSRNEKFKMNDGISNEYKKVEIGRNTVITALPGTNTNFPFEKDNEFSNIVKSSTDSKNTILISDVVKPNANPFLEKIEPDLEEITVLNIKGISTRLDETVCNIPKALREEMIGGIEFKENEVKIQPQHDIPSTLRPGNIINTKFSVGFTTASKKHISISNKAKQKADEMIKKFEQDEKEKRILESKFLIPEEHIGNVKKNKNASEKKVNSILRVGGFKTASEKPIVISLEAKRKAEEFLKTFEEAENPEKLSEKLTQQHPSELTEEVRQKAQNLLIDIEFFEEAFEDELKKIQGMPMLQVKNEKQKTETNVCSEPKNDKIVGEFKTASRKPIHISEEANRRAKTFFNMVCDEDLPQEYLKCIETNINTNGIVEQVDDAIESSRYDHFNAPKTESIQMHATNSIEFFNASENRITDRSQSDPKKEGLRELKKDAHLYSREHNIIENMTLRKRKLSEGDDLQKSSLSVTPRRLSCGERVPLNRIENGLLCKSLSLPLKEGIPNSTIISRKNLLSLSKRKKIDSPRQTNESKSGPKTPEKSLHSPMTRYNVSSTPKLKHFFETVSTSTPRLVRNDPINMSQNPPKDTLDSDFRRIQWEDSNYSLRINRTSCVDDVNVTFSAVSPSPQQRIEQLKMYGEPPPISPISMLNKCRPSGLRRGRSLMKP